MGKLAMALPGTVSHTGQEVCFTPQGAAAQHLPLLHTGLSEQVLCTAWRFASHVAGSPVSGMPCSAHMLIFLQQPTKQRLKSNSASGAQAAGNQARFGPAPPGPRA